MNEAGSGTTDVRPVSWVRHSHMVVSPTQFYGRDHSGGRMCDGLIHPGMNGRHYRNESEIATIRRWLELERKLFEKFKRDNDPQSGE